MNYLFSRFKVTIVALILLLGLATTTAIATDYTNNDRSTSNYFSEEKLESLTRSITVRVFPKEDPDRVGGSGILIDREGDQYTVLTNHHVILDANLNYQIQTPDGRTHQVKSIPSIASEDDISFLVFESKSKIYKTIPLKPKYKISKNKIIFAGGFPFQEDLKQAKIMNFTKGKITLITDRPFVGGYQIGYTNDITNGMSGGPLIDNSGILIGINGMGKNPLFGNPYTFKDGSTIADADWQTISELSWAIPIRYNILNQLLQFKP